MEDLSYPIGKFSPLSAVSDAKLIHFIDEIAAAPDALKAAVWNLSNQQLDTPYRPGGWTVRQVVHHLPDSHMNAYMRFKLALTENKPMIKPFEQQLWAELPDSKRGDIEMSMNIFENLHLRWVLLLRNLKPPDFERKYVHPVTGATTLERALQLYAWHGKHHIAHITSLRTRMGW